MGGAPSPSGIVGGAASSSELVGGAASSNEIVGGAAAWDLPLVSFDTPLTPHIMAMHVRTLCGN